MRPGVGCLHLHGTSTSRPLISFQCLHVSHAIFLISPPSTLVQGYRDAMLVEQSLPP